MKRSAERVPVVPVMSDPAASDRAVAGELTRLFLGDLRRQTVTRLWLWVNGTLLVWGLLQLVTVAVPPGMPGSVSPFLYHGIIMTMMGSLPVWLALPVRSDAGLMLVRNNDSHTIVETWMNGPAGPADRMVTTMALDTIRLAMLRGARYRGLSARTRALLRGLALFTVGLVAVAESVSIYRGFGLTFGYPDASVSTIRSEREASGDDQDNGFARDTLDDATSTKRPAPMMDRRYRNLDMDPSPASGSGFPASGVQRGAAASMIPGTGAGSGQQGSVQGGASATEGRRPVPALDPLAGGSVHGHSVAAAPGDQRAPLPDGTAAGRDQSPDEGSGQTGGYGSTTDRARSSDAAASGSAGTGDQTGTDVASRPGNAGSVARGWQGSGAELEATSVTDYRTRLMRQLSATGGATVSLGSSPSAALIARAVEVYHASYGASLILPESPEPGLAAMQELWLQPPAGASREESP